MPVKSGSGGPSATMIVTGLVCGQVVPAGGLVPVTVPTGAFEPTLTMVKVRCTRCSAACASACFSPFTAGTREVNGPLETRMVTAVPFATRPDGLVPTTVPLATVLLCTWRWPDRTVKPSAVSTAVAWLTLTPDTVGTWAYRPEVSHQPPSPSPTPSTMTSATMTSRGPNSQRPRNGSRPPPRWWRPPSPWRSGRPRGPPPACANPPAAAAVELATACRR